MIVRDVRKGEKLHSADKKVLVERRDLEYYYPPR